ncbi:MAG: amidohydrolase [Bacillota bacterium]
MYDLLLTNGHVVTVNGRRDSFHPGAVAVTGATIQAVGPAAEFSGAQAQRVIDVSGKLVFPGLVNTHTHLFQTLLKGLGDDLVLSDWLLAATLPSAIEFKAREAYASALLGCLDALHSGTTTLLDYNYAHPVPMLGDEAIRAFRATGIRAILARGTTDAGAQFGIPAALRQPGEEILADFRRLYEAYHGADNGRLRVWLAPGSGWGCSEWMLREVRRLATECRTGITIHVSETPWDREAAAAVHGGRSDFGALEAYGVLGPDLVMVHCVCLTPEEIAVTARHDVKVSHNPVSNMYLASGVAPVPAMLSAGVVCSLATDGAASNNTQDMIEVLKSAALLHKVATLDPTAMTAEQVLELATIDGARALGMEDSIGSLEAGKRADLFVFDPGRSARSVPMHHPVSTLVYSGSAANVELVMVDGRIVVEDGAVTCLDERAALAEAQLAATELAARAGTAGRARNRPWPRPGSAAPATLPERM